MLYRARDTKLKRAPDSLSARLLDGTDFATYPFWSPDSRSVGFFADGKLRRIEIDGGPAQTPASAEVKMAVFGRARSRLSRRSLLHSPMMGS